MNIIFTCTPTIAIRSLCYLFLAILSVLSSSQVSANDNIKFNGILDIRGIQTDDNLSWLNGGLGKSRYGNNSSRLTGNLAEAALITTIKLNPNVKSRFYIKYDNEQKNQLDLIEGFLSYRSNHEGNFNYQFKAGLFFPPISLENRLTGWIPVNTITPSAINSWVGDELKTLGGEARLTYEGESSRTGFIVAIFTGNDPAGSLLAWRGWAMGDRKTGFNDEVPLPAIPTIQSNGTFKDQAPWVQPFHEIDDRLGFYSGLSWSNLDNIATHIYYYDNRADQMMFDGFQYAWKTRFVATDLKLQFYSGIEILSQFMSGATQMGGKQVDVDFNAFYLLLNKNINQYTITLRYDYFNLKDQDATPDDDNNENGHAWTAALKRDLSENHSMLFEILNIASKRHAQLYFGHPIKSNTIISQFSLRLIF